MYAQGEGPAGEASEVDPYPRPASPLLASSHPNLSDLVLGSSACPISRPNISFAEPQAALQAL